MGAAEGGGGRGYGPLPPEMALWGVARIGTPGRTDMSQEPAGQKKSREPSGASGPGEGEDGRVARARQRRRVRRVQIVEAAQRVFAAKGYHSASISDVIAAAGTSRGTFYTYFDGKRAIFDTLLDELFGKLTACIRPVDVSSGTSTVMAQLRGNVQRAVETVVHNQDLVRILSRAGHGIDPGFDRKVEEFDEAVLDLIRRALRGGMEVRIVRPLDTDLVAHCIYGSVKQSVFYLLESGRLEEGSAAGIVEEVLRHNLHGVLQE